MAKSSFIPQSTRTRILSKEESEIKLSKFIDRFNEGKKYGQRIISSQINTVKTLIGELSDKLSHRLTSGRRFHITVGTLAKMCKCSVKTAYNHICRLIEAGIIRKARTTHKFRYEDEGPTPCLLLELSLEILIFHVAHIPSDEDKSVDLPKTYAPEIPPIGIEIMKQLKIYPYDE